MNHDTYEDRYIREVLSATRTIAMVGASPNWNRPSFFVMKYLQLKDFRVVPVNPRAEGEVILGERTYASLGEVPDAIDMVDVFRSAKEAMEITKQAIAKSAKFVWMQIGVRNDDAAGLAEDAGLRVVMNRCPKIEYSRLYGELSWGGFNSGVISSKRRKT